MKLRDCPAESGMVDTYDLYRILLRPDMLFLMSFVFHDLKFCLSSQLKAASSARCSSEMPPSMQVNGHSFTICLIVWGSPQSQSGEAMTPHSCMMMRHGPSAIH